MNRLLGFFNLSKKFFDREKFISCSFKTPHWQPDHKEFYFDSHIALSSTQRFITAECADCLMPFQDKESQLVINADVYLTNREELIALLLAEPSLADAKLILKAYLKWGASCTKYLSGQFCFVIWNPHKKELFSAVDPFSSAPFFYAYQPQHAFIFANELSPFHQLCPTLTIREQHFIEFALDTFSSTKTSYEEVLKLPPGHQLIINEQGVKQQRYWRLQDQKEKLSCQTREEYYAIFRQHFERAVKACLRGTGPIASHISGGLDSSSVAAQAAKLLSEKQQHLHGITAIPNGLDGPSYRKNWYYHEMPRVQTLLDRYPNIKHFAYMAEPDADIFSKLKALHHYTDQPIRNIANFEWIMGGYEYVRSQGGRTLLTGQAGNGSISWAGSSRLDSVRRLYHALKIMIRPANLYGGFFRVLNPQLLNSTQGKKLLRQRGIILNPHKHLLSGEASAPLIASAYAIQLWHGVRVLDPTRDLALTQFCYHVPQRIYRKGKKTLQRRLLVREGLSDLLPEDIALNPYRGEQAADAYLQYNTHQHTWKKTLLNLDPDVKKILWNAYNESTMMNFFHTYPKIEITTVDEKILATYNNLMRCMGIGFYLNDIMKKPGAHE